MEQSIVVSDSLKFGSKEYSHPKYKLAQLYPLNGQPTGAVTTGGDEVIFQFPVKVFNLAQSILEMTITPLAPGADSHNIAYKRPLTPVRQIQLYTQGGVYLCDLYNVNKYLDTVYYPETSLEDFLCNEITTAVAGVKSIGTHRNNVITSLAAAVGINPDKIVIPANGQGANNMQADPTISYTEKLYYQPSSDNNIANPILNISFPMGSLYNTIFSVNKDIFIGEIINMRIVFESVNDVFYKYTADTAGAISSAIASVAAATSYTISNIYFYLAVEQDLNIANTIMSKVLNGGMVLPIPYVYTYRQTLIGGQDQTITLRFNRAHGKKLRKIYHVPYDGHATTVYNYNRDNTAGALAVQYYYTLLNNDRLQDFNINCTQYKDWQLHQKKLEKSSIQSVQEYQSNWFHVEDFTSEKPLWSQESKDVSFSSGISLDSEQKWDIYMYMNDGRAAPAAGFLHYDFAITEKELSISPGAIKVY